MRYSRQEDLLKLALMMQGSAEGISIADIERAFLALVGPERTGLMGGTAPVRASGGDI